MVQLDADENRDIGAILLDYAVAGSDGVAAIEQLRASRSDLPLLILADEGAFALEAMRAGASDFLLKPVAADRLLGALHAAADRRKSGGELRPLTEKISRPLEFDEIVGSAPAFRATLATAAKSARSRAPVLIEGENGTGKELIAQAIHAASPRSKLPLITVHCGAIPPNLAESILFGHEKGSFTGAFDRHIGLCEDADGGTLFLDEIGELPFEVQAKVLRVLETGEMQRVGSPATFTVDVRILAASNGPLTHEIDAGRFREDLFYRLNVVHVDVPALRDRTSDIPALARHLLARLAEQSGLPTLGISDDALALLMSYGWPGNVRQLQNVLFRAALLCESGSLTAVDFPQIAQESTFGKRASDRHAKPLQVASAEAARATAPGIALHHPDGHLRTLEEIEADVIRFAIGHYHGRMSEVARRLGIGRSTLYRKLAELGISEAAA